MIAAAPGKLFLTGAWAILEGASAIVVAVDRYVTADTSRPNASPDRPEIKAVARILDEPCPAIDAASLERDGRKLGLGSSAAGAVAAAGSILAGRGDDLSSSETRERVLRIARSAHEESQPLGSGGDLAAATYGGVIEARRDGHRLHVTKRPWPLGLHWCALTTDRPMRTSEALDRFADHRDAPSVRAAMSTLTSAAIDGAKAWAAGDPRGYLNAAALHAIGLAALGSALDLPLTPREVPRAHELLGSMAESSVLLPSGAGGGDVVVWLGRKAPSEATMRALLDAGLMPLELSIDERGLHVPLQAQ